MLIPIWLWPPSRSIARRTSPLELHDLDIDAGHDLEKLSRQMLEASGARSRPNQLAGLLLRERDKLFHRVGRNARMDDERHRPASQLRDRGKGFHRIKREVVEGRVRGEKTGDNEQSVTIRGRLRCHFRAEDPSRPAVVLHDHLLAEAFSQFGGDQAPDDVGARARWNRNDEPHRLVRISIGRRENRSRRDCECQRNNAA